MPSNLNVMKPYLTVSSAGTGDDKCLTSLYNLRQLICSVSRDLADSVCGHIPNGRGI